MALDHEVFASRCRDVDVGGVGAAPSSDLGAVLVDDRELPFGGVGDGFEAVGGCGWVVALEMKASHLNGRRTGMETHC